MYLPINERYINEYINNACNADSRELEFMHKYGLIDKDGNLVDKEIDPKEVKRFFNRPQYFGDPAEFENEEDDELYHVDLPDYVDVPDDIDDEEAAYLDSLKYIGTELNDVGPIEPLPADVEAELTSYDDVDESAMRDLPILEGSTLTVSDDDDSEYRLFDESKKNAAKKKLPIRKDYKKSCGCC